MIKVLLTQTPLVNGKLADGEHVFQGKMNADGTVARNQRAARFHGEGRSAVRLMDDDWHFRIHDVTSAKHAYVLICGEMVEVKFQLEVQTFKRLEVGKLYRVTETARVNGNFYSADTIVELLSQEDEDYTGKLVYRVRKVNTDDIGWAAEAHKLELV